MSLEQKIEALTEALNANTAALKAAKGGAAASAPAESERRGPGRPAKPKGPTMEEVTAAAKAYATAHGKPAAKALIAKHGGDDLKSLPESAWAAFVEDTKNAPAEPEDEDDGL